MTQNKVFQTTWQQALPEFSLLLFFYECGFFLTFFAEFNAFQNTVITN
jgi:hypothetical protein